MSFSEYDFIKLSESEAERLKIGRLVTILLYSAKSGNALVEGRALEDNSDTIAEACLQGAVIIEAANDLKEPRKKN